MLTQSQLNGIGLNIVFGVEYGSHAKGFATEDSDPDILLISKSPIPAYLQVGGFDPKGKTINKWKGLDIRILDIRHFLHLLFKGNAEMWTALNISPFINELGAVRDKLVEGFHESRFLAVSPYQYSGMILQSLGRKDLKGLIYASYYLSCAHFVGRNRRPAPIHKNDLKQQLPVLQEILDLDRSEELSEKDYGMYISKIKHYGPKIEQAATTSEFPPNKKFFDDIFLEIIGIAQETDRGPI